MTFIYKVYIFIVSCTCCTSSLNTCERQKQWILPKATLLNSAPNICRPHNHLGFTQSFLLCSARRQLNKTNKTDYSFKRFDLNETEAKWNNSDILSHNRTLIWGRWWVAWSGLLQNWRLMSWYILLMLHSWSATFQLSSRKLMVIPAYQKHDPPLAWSHQTSRLHTGLSVHSHLPP